MDYQRVIIALDTIRKTAQKILDERNNIKGSNQKMEFIKREFHALLPFFSILLENFEVPQMPEELKKQHALEIARLKKCIKEQRDLIYRLSTATNIGDGYL